MLVHCIRYDSGSLILCLLKMRYSLKKTYLNHDVYMFKYVYIYYTNMFVFLTTIL